MLLWSLFAIVTAGALLAILRPLAFGRAESMPSDSAFDAAVYRDQLAELERDRARGLISSTETEAARNEIARRLLRAGEGAQGPSPSDPHTLRHVVLSTVVILPTVAIAVYLLNGSPQIPGLPYEQRLADATANRDTDALIAKVEKHLANVPDDVAGWLVIGRAYRSLGRYADAARAFSEAVNRSTPDADLLTDTGEMLVLQGDGTVPPESSALFSKALELDPENPRARYFHALSTAQAGGTAKAVEEWQALLEDSPADADWRPLVLRRIEAAKLGTVAPVLTDEQMAAAEGMSENERAGMISGMVDKLADKLAKNGDDIDGWLMLARARAVLGQTAAARAALDRASDIFKQDGAARARIDDMRKSLPQ